MEEHEKKSVTPTFKAADDVKKGLQMAEDVAKRIREGKCDWGKDEDVAFAESVDRAQNGLRKRPKDGVCPNCKEYVSGKWVYEGKGAPMCWGCWQAGGALGYLRGRGRPVKPGECGPMRNGEWVAKCRVIRRWSRETLGRKVGKSMAWVQKVECGGIRLKAEMQDALEAIFSAP